MTTHWLKDVWRDHDGEGPIHLLQDYCDAKDRTWTITQNNYLDKIVLECRDTGINIEFNNIAAAKSYVTSYLKVEKSQKV